MIGGRAAGSGQETVVVGSTAALKPTVGISESEAVDQPAICSLKATVVELDVAHKYIWGPYYTPHIFFTAYAWRPYMTLLKYLFREICSLKRQASHPI